MKHIKDLENFLNESDNQDVKPTNEMKKYNIIIQGYGAEVTIGSVDEEQKEILNNTDKELWEIASQDLEDYGSWYEIDDQYHRCGASGPFTIIVQDENGDVLYEIDSDNLHEFDTDDFELVEYEYVEIDESKDLLMCVSFEKGSFFEGEILTQGDFDITKLKINIEGEVGINEYYFGDIVSDVYYDGEEVDNYGGSTDGKSFDVTKNF
jgi:hypothetical protein